MAQHNQQAQMELVGVRFTKALIAEMDKMVRDGTYANKSELIRDGARRIVAMQSGMLNGRYRPVCKDQIAKEYAKERKFKFP